MVNNVLAMIGIVMYILGLYLHVYDIGNSKFSILFYLIGAAFIMFEFLTNSVKNDEVE